MARKVTTRIEGAKEMDRVLRTLPRAMGRRAAIGALRAGAVPIAEEAELNAPRKSGELAENILIRTARDQGQVTVLIGPARSAFQGIFQEFGTKNHPAQPFMRPAFDSKAVEALAIIGDRLGKNLTRAAKRLAGPIGKSGLLRRRR
jgi:HK97 gp10 family phage protein